ncbi:MAG: hypothetical protein WCW78_01360 [Candidatus Paceibacterota bacterium]|jgi:hypothetical protein
MNRLLIFSIFFTFVAFPPSSFAQTSPTAYITWRANNFYPAGFTGKALPTPGTRILVAAEIVKNGKLFDSSTSLFSWSVDGRLALTGVGKKEYSFTATKNDNNSHFVQVSVKMGVDIAVDSLTIPLTIPQAVIEAPFPFGRVPENTKGSAQAIPYFFNVTSFSDLLFSWRVNSFEKNAGTNNQLAFETGSPQLASDKLLEIVSYIQTAKGAYELATSRAQLTIIK